MAIKTAFFNDFVLWGDGVSTTVTFDLLNTPFVGTYVQNPFGKMPTDVQTFDGDVSSISVSGTEVTIVYSAAFSGSHITTIYVLF